MQKAHASFGIQRDDCRTSGMVCDLQICAHAVRQPHAFYVEPQNSSAVYRRNFFDQVYLQISVRLFRQGDRQHVPSGLVPRSSSSYNSKILNSR